MGMEMKLEVRLSQRLVMTPMLQQAIKLLPMTKLELVQAIRQEMEENPLLDELAPELEEEKEEKTESEKAEEQSIEGEQEQVFEEQTPLAEKEKESDGKDDIDWDAYIQSDLYDGGTGEGYIERPSLENTLRQKESLEEHLMWQLSCSALTEEESQLGSTIIGNIDDTGYLEADLAVLAEEAQVSLDVMEDALVLIQSFDPPGVAARDIKECLSLQLYAAGMKNSLAEKLVIERLEDLNERQFSKISKAYDVDVEEVIEAIRVIRELNPKPGLEFNKEDTHYITPDLYVVKIDGEYQVYLNDDGIPKLRINQYYKSILKNKNESKSESQKVTKDYVENKFRSAIWMIKSIEQRRQTMLKVGRSICKFQREFLDKGINYLKPLILRNVADDIEMHESTVSRVTTNKYIHTPQGLLDMKFFFHSAVGSYLGNDLSSVRVKEMIRQICKDEDAGKPHTDDQIVKLLQSKDVKIARRTVTKYRKELHILPTSKRRRLYL
ncbi:RNA polymerase sigma-54 factor RpoN [hydrothermal vent metagenome]|uniref:RNA polymerase sigma-54 factor RpoN n=1 Tax=hydrothermal vent metagenome TaxID=652676 RepID=A0A3B1BUZ5_9ZZZZ